MSTPSLSVRELREDDVERLTDYWMNAGDAFLLGMGVDLTKMPKREEWISMLTGQARTPLESKKSYCLIWLEDEKPIGHSNVNKIIFGEEAYMHLHLWNSAGRKRGAGTQLVKLGLPYFFENLRLKKLYCEPYAQNPAPNRTLEKAGFKFLRTYCCTPGWLNFEQEVNLWEMDRETYEKLAR